MNLLSACLILTAFAQVAGPPDRSAPADSLVVQTTVSQVNREPAILTLDAGSDAGVQIGDPFWILDRARVLACGTLFLVTPSSSAGRFSTSAQNVPRAAAAVIVRSSGVVQARDALPEGVTLHGRLVRLSPSRHTAWLDIGARTGLGLGDMLLVSRDGIPIARGRVAQLDDRTALAALRPVVGNARPQPGDAVELWPAPAERRQGRLNSVVLQVIPDPEGALVRFVGSSADGVVAGRLVDLYRHDAYVGVAVIRDVFDPISVAQLITSASARPAEECDVAVVRPAPPDPPLRAAIFKVVEDGSYCLLAAGESDGLQVGERFVVYGGDPEDPSRRQERAELTVDAVKFYHSGATIRLLKPHTGPLQVWDFAERRMPSWTRWGAVGVVRQVEPAARWAVADIDPRCKLRPGQIIRWAPATLERTGPADRQRAPGAAVILAASTDLAVLYIPYAWGDLQHLNHARIEVLMSPPSH